MIVLETLKTINYKHRDLLSDGGTYIQSTFQIIMSQQEFFVTVQIDFYYCLISICDKGITSQSHKSRANFDQNHYHRLLLSIIQRRGDVTQFLIWIVTVQSSRFVSTTSTPKTGGRFSPA